MPGDLKLEVVQPVCQERGSQGSHSGGPCVTAAQGSRAQWDEHVVLVNILCLFSLKESDLGTHAVTTHCPLDQ